MGERSFFVEPGAIREGRAELTGPVAHQIRNVLRLRPGDTVELLDNSGFVQMARLVTLSREGVIAEVVERRRSNTEPGVELVLYQALMKGQKMELVLQKGTEIGVSRFVPVLSERCVSRPSEADLERRLERWQAIVREAAEQSGRAVLPPVSRLESFGEACRNAAAAGLALVAWEEEHALGIGGVLRESVTPFPTPSAIQGEGIEGSPSPSVGAGVGVGGRRPRISLLVGPEGGFSPKEAQVAREAGVKVVSLGPRILRAETAALVAATLVLCATGDMGG